MNDWLPGTFSLGQGLFSKKHKMVGVSQTSWEIHCFSGKKWRNDFEWPARWAGLLTCESIAGWGSKRYVEFCGPDEKGH